MSKLSSRSLLLLLFHGVLPCFPVANAQDAAAETARNQTTHETASKIVTFTTQEDHREMQKQLGIAKLRPGPSGNPSDPNAANTDESKANPYPDLPDVMTLKNGDKVTTPEMWWKQRRPEIVEDFERDVIGRIPANVPGVKWEVRETREGKSGDASTIEKHLIGVVDNSACPEIQVQISMSLVVPKNAKEPVPVLMMFGSTPFDPLPPWLAGRRGAGGPPGPTRESQVSIDATSARQWRT